MGTAVTHAPAMEDLTKDSEPRHRPAKSPRPAALKRRGRRETLAGYLFMSPWIAGFLLLTAGPMAASLYFAFTDYNLFDAPKWIGLDNFSEMFADPRWRNSVRVTLWYVVVGTPIKLIAALGVALLLAQKRRGQAFYRAAFYAPSLIGASVSIAIVWKAIFSDDAIVDRTQKIFGIDVGGWTGDPDMIIYSLVALTVWQFGAPMVIFLAGLKQVPRELYEAAEVDGAGTFRRFWNITLPMISPSCSSTSCWRRSTPSRSSARRTSSAAAPEATPAVRRTVRWSTPVICTSRASRTAGWAWPPRWPGCCWSRSPW